jgi:hypothetical protein
VYLAGQLTAWAQEPIQFEDLLIDDPVTFMEMSADGKSLALAHQDANKVSVYDVLQLKVTAIIQTPSPRIVLHRAGQLIVGSRNDASIKTYAEVGKTWKLKREAKIPTHGLVHLSAAYGRAFRNELLVTCHEDGSNGPRSGCLVYALDSGGKFKPVAKVPLATLSFDGQALLTQEPFNLSPSGNIRVFRTLDFLGYGNKANRLNSGGEQQTQFVYQVTPSNYLIGRSSIYTGTPLHAIDRDLGRSIIPNRSRELVYGLSEEKLSVHQLDGTLSLVRDVPVKLPAHYLSDRGARGHLEAFFGHSHQRDYVLDHPEAYTHGGRTFLFLRTHEGGRILAAEFLGLEKKPEPESAKPMQGAPAGPNKETAANLTERKWTSSDANFTLMATFVTQDASHITLRRSSDGQEIRLPLSALSDIDREVAAELAEQNRPTVDRAKGPPRVANRSGAMRPEELQQEETQPEKTEKPIVASSDRREPQKPEIVVEKGSLVTLSPYCQVTTPKGFEWKILSAKPPVFSADGTGGNASFRVQINAPATSQAEKQAMARWVYEGQLQELQEQGFQNIKPPKMDFSRQLDNAVKFVFSAKHPTTESKFHWAIRILFDQPNHTFVFKGIALKEKRAHELVKRSNSLRPLKLER